LISTAKIRESTSGPTGGFRPTLRRPFLISGRKSWTSNIHMMRRPFSRSSER
jgi:hypothetical protein